MQALLIHGMGRTPLAMSLLAWRLRRQGWTCHLFGYSATIESFDSIVGRLARRLTALADGPYVGIGHSLGGLLLRNAVARLDPAIRRPDHLILLGTPVRSPRLASGFRPRWLYHVLNGDSGKMLADPVRMGALVDPQVPTTMIAGTAGPRGRWSPFGDDANDGIVSVSEVTIPDATLIELPLLHTFMMNSRRVADIIAARATSRNLPAEVAGDDP